MKNTTVMMFVTMTTLGCTHHPEYQQGDASNFVNEIQILDPGAPERNDGITTSLDGNYGKKVMTLYQKSPYEVQSARDIKHIKSEK